MSGVEWPLWRLAIARTFSVGDACRGAQLPLDFLVSACVSVCVFVVQVLRRLRDECGVDLQCVDAKDLFFDRLAGVSDPETKRKIIGVTFCEVRGAPRGVFVGLC